MLSVQPARAWQRTVTLLSCFIVVSLILSLGGQPFGPNFSAAQQKNPSQTTRASQPARAHGSVYLSDLTPNFQANGRGPIERDQSNGGLQVLDGSALAIKGVTYRKGL